MADLEDAFEERLEEIKAYLEFLQGIEDAAQSGPPRLGSGGLVISTQHQRILYSGVFLQLYNLVEATIVRCLDQVTDAALQANTFAPADLSNALRREWVRVMARTHIDLNYEHRLDSALALCDHLVAALPVPGFKLEKGGGGNWDDQEIEAIAGRLGFQLRISAPTYQAIKRPFRDELGPLGLVKKLRNSLAHGAISFTECGENLTVSELRDLADRTSAYLREVVLAFETFVAKFEYLVEERRPKKVET